MQRIQGVPRQKAGPMVRLVYRFMSRGLRRMTGRPPAHGTGLGPIEVWAHQPKLMTAMGKFQGPLREAKGLDERLKNVCELKGAQLIGCEFCVDLGSQICRNSGLSDDELLGLIDYGSSNLFTAREKAALDYTVAVMRTPVHVTDELFARLKAHFDDAQIIQLTAFLMVVNLDRFNAALGIGSAGFSEGMVCLTPDRAGAEASVLSGRLAAG